MFASSDFQPATIARREPSTGPCAPGEGRDSVASHRATAALLLPAGRPSVWLLLLAGSCVYVVVQALVLRFA
jgi:hypothetical protein